MPAPGDSLGPYQVGAHLGCGGMGEVFKAHDPRLSRDVALKVSYEAPCFAQSPTRVRERSRRSADGQRFLVNAYPADSQSSLDVLINWPASLEK
jgi:serine/threonine protein kinase